MAYFVTAVVSLIAGLCRQLKFATPVDGFALEGHVIRNISLSVGMRDTCKDRCTMEDACVSINIGPPIDDKVLCQLSDSDHMQHPGDLKSKEGFIYRGTEVRNLTQSVTSFKYYCQRKPCKIANTSTEGVGRITSC